MWPAYSYVLIDIGCLLFPFLFSFRRDMPFYTHWRDLLPGLALMWAVFLPWDIFFTARGIWGFSDRYTIGADIAGLPVEEWLFFLCVPYACVFTYASLKFLLPDQPLRRFARIIGWSLAVFSAALALTHVGNWYTFSACSLATILLVLHLAVWRSDYLGWFFLSWAILLIPFFLSNGLLTGRTFWDYPLWNDQPDSVTDPIVWYNNAHNLGVRFWSVPADDFFYGMSMVLLTITGYEFSRRRLTRPA